MKDCKFTVMVGGKKVVYDYDGFRHFLMGKGNLAKVAPEFAGGVSASDGEADKPSAPQKLMQEQSEPVGVASWFSGTGTVEAALGKTRSVMAVEYEPAIIEQFNKAHGTTFKARDVASVSPSEVKASGATLFHASPVCKNFSKANRFREASDMDLVSAKAVARVIREAAPPVVTVENVPDYAKTELFKLITDALDEKGYTWRSVVIDAADLGAPQRRKRLIVQAVKDGNLPPLPEKQPATDWYKAVSDLIADAPDSEIPNWEQRRLNAMIARGLLDAGKPIITMGGSVGASVAAAANAGGPSPTLKASNQVVRIILPNGQVKRVTPRMMARLMGLPDTFPVPDNPKLATTVLGNGIQGEITRKLIKPLLESTPTALAPVRGIQELDLYKKPQGLVEDPFKTPPRTTSQYKTGPEARAALEEIEEQFVERGLKLNKALNAARQPLTIVSNKRTQEEQDALEEAFRKAQREFYELAMDRRLAMIDAVSPGGLADITWESVLLKDETIVTGKYKTDISVERELTDKTAQEGIQRGVDFFRRVVGDHPDLRGASVKMRYHPENMERAHYASGRVGYVPTRGGVRHSTAGSVLLTGKTHSTITIVHELGHWLEDLSDTTHDKAIEFLKRRAGTEQARPLNELNNTNVFNDTEVAIKDNFKDAYVGKYYGKNWRDFVGGKKGLMNWDTAYASEVISMGVEYLASDPLKFAKTDPDYFDFIFDVLRVGR